MSYFEPAIIALILLGICFLVFRGGQANPESTGRLARRIGQVESELKGVKGKVTEIETRVTEIDRRGATIADIERIEGKLADAKEARDRIEVAANQLVVTVAADHEAIQWIKGSLGRMDQYLRDRDG